MDLPIIQKVVAKRDDLYFILQYITPQVYLVHNEKKLPRLLE